MCAMVSSLRTGINVLISSLVPSSSRELNTSENGK